MQFKNLWVTIFGVWNPGKSLHQKGKEIMRIGQKIMDAKTKTIYRIARIEKDLIILTAEDGSDELVIRDKKSGNSK